MVQKLAVIFLLLIGTFSQTPLPPLWPNVFWQNFTEITFSVSAGVHKTTGAYYYNWTMPAYRIARFNGRYDSSCGLSGPHATEDTPCEQIVVDGNRFVYYPILNQCCYCCNDANGCGVLIPTWFSDAKYIDTEVHNGILSYKWLKKGNQNNFIWETTGNVPVQRQTIAINEDPGDIFDFDLGRLDSFPQITVPSICSLTNTCDWGLCQEVRSGLSEFKEALYS